MIAKIDVTKKDVEEERIRIDKDRSNIEEDARKIYLHAE